MKYNMEIDKAKALIKKLDTDTSEEKLTWIKIPLEENVKLDTKKKGTLAAIKDDYHFTAQIGDTGLTANLQYINGRYFIWVEQMGEIANVCNEFYEDEELVHLAVKLDKLICHTANKRILTAVDKYIG